ncbi:MULTISPECIES: polysaccharide pyruvyl transferase family protein [unclassified Helicobacter]|uniref:polysaccharide pyruvyl transferase family protein n=1 Tax=unclassified Helicobacter TaxID=2593540 RepID=UPI0015F18CA4|nr:MULTISPECIES: polysaccharide pyruvyl transferase family protein [unclassified Helicobacter]
MKKPVTIGVVTFNWDGHNYGQVLQAYALQRYLRDEIARNGINAEVRQLNVSPFFASKSSWRKYIKIFILKIFGEKAFKAIKRLKARLLLGKESFMQWERDSRLTEMMGYEYFSQYIQDIESKRKFLEFREANINLIPLKIRDYEGYKDDMWADIYIAGSDQVWNCWSVDNILNNAVKKRSEYYMLNFVDKSKLHARKVSYAASFGLKEISDNIDKSKSIKEYARKALSDFDAISVREEQGVRILESLGLQGVCVADPTMLLKKADYERILSPLQVQNDIFVYMLGAETFIDKNALMEIIKQYQFLYTNAHPDFSCKYDLQTQFFPTPQEWLGAVRDSQMMITNSFHGCVFAIIMHTPFYYLRLKSDDAHTRLETLLKVSGLENRVLTDISQVQEVISATLQKRDSIDWQSVDSKINAFVEKGKVFLQKEVFAFIS